MNKSNDQIEELIDSLSDIQKVNAPDDFESNLYARLDSELSPNPFIRWIKYGVAALVIMCLSNGFTLFYLQKSNESEFEDIKYFSEDLMNSQQFEYFNNN